MSVHFEVVVLGAGPGGYVAAVRAGQLGLKTAIVELKYWGGVCNNVGCIPTKSLLRNAEIAHIFNHEADVFGISGDVTFDFGAAWKRSRAAADRMAKGVHFLMKKNKVTEIDGWGTFIDDHTLSVKGPNGTEAVTFDNVIIAAGATTRLLPGTSLSERVVTYEEQIMTDSLPESILIAGAGAICTLCQTASRNAAAGSGPCSWWTVGGLMIRRCGSTGISRPSGSYSRT